jgi:hypothetical protein
MIKGGEVPMQNEAEVVSHIFKRAVFFCEEEALFVFKREINLKFPAIYTKNI